MDPILIDLGFIVITWYAFLIVLGMLIGIILFFKEAKKHYLDLEVLYDLVFYTLIFGIVGARIWYVIFAIDDYIGKFWQVFAIWNGGLAIHGGIIGGLLTIIYFSHKYNLHKLLILDLAVPSLLLAQSIGRWGNFINQEAHGGQTTYEFLHNILHLPQFIVQGMNIDGIYYHPTFLYESIWNFMGFLITLILRKKFRYNYGILTGFYLIWYGTIRFFIEQMRTDALLLGEIKVAQLTSLIMFIVGIILLIIIYKRRKNE